MIGDDVMNVWVAVAGFAVSFVLGRAVGRVGRAVKAYQVGYLAGRVDSMPS